MIKVKLLVPLCRIMPCLWAGETEDERYIWIRGKYDYFTVTVSPAEEEKELSINTILELRGNSKYAFLTYDEMVELTKNVLDFSECTIKEHDK